MPSVRGLEISVGRLSRFKRIFIVSNILVAARAMLLLPPTKGFPASVLGRSRFGVLSSRHCQPNYHRFVQTTKRADCPYSRRSTRASGLQFSALDSESSSVKNVDIEEFETIQMDEELEEEGPAIDLPKGSNNGFYIVKTYKTQSGGFDMNLVRAFVEAVDVERLELTSQNLSVPVALMMVDLDEFPSQSRARKACRNSNVMIHRGPLPIDDETGKEVFDSAKCLRARVGDRLFPGGRFVSDNWVHCDYQSYNRPHRRLGKANTDGRGIFSCDASQKAPF